MATPLLDDRDSSTGNKYRDDWQQGGSAPSKQQESEAKYGEKASLGDREADAESGEAGGSLSADELAAAESDDDDSGLYNPDESPFGAIKKKFWTRRKKTAGAFGAGGIVTTLIFISIFGGAIKLPSIMGGFENDLPSSRMTRLIVEKRVKNMLIKYMVAKKAGTISSLARPGSALEKVYALFDRLGVEDIMKRQNGLEFKLRDGRVHITHRGRAVGSVDADPAKGARDFKLLESKDKLLARESRKLATRTFPVADIMFGGTLRRWTVAMGFIRRYSPPVPDPANTPEENIKKEITAKELAKGPTEVANLFEETAACVLEGKCEGLPDRSNQPIDTADPRASGGLAKSAPGVPEVDNETAKALEEETKQALTQAGGEALPTEAVTHTVLERALNSVATKIIAEVATLVGIIDIMASLQSTAEAFDDADLTFEKIFVQLREHQAASITAAWLAHSDNLKDSKLQDPFIQPLSDRLTGYDQGAMVMAMYGRSGTSVPVEPKIGSADADFNKDFATNALEATAEDLGHLSTCQNGYEIVNSGPCINRAILAAFHKFVHPVIDKLGAVLEVLKYTFPQYWAFRVGTNLLYGDNWQEELGKKMVTKFLILTGVLGYDPTASGAKLGNSIGVGMDVIFNRYSETNLGGRNVTSDPGAALVYMQANQEYEEDFRALPLRDRLFATDVPHSLVNRLAVAMPSSAEPATLVSSLVGSIKALPLNIFSAFSGRGFAAATPASIAAVDGVAQFGGSQAELDADIPAEVANQVVNAPQDVQCPANAPGVFNNCQSYKEAIQITMCMDPVTPCPQFQN